MKYLSLLLVTILSYSCEQNIVAVAQNIEENSLDYFLEFDITSINYLGVMWTPYLVLGIVLASCSVLSISFAIGIVTSLLIAGLMWWRRWAVANEPLEL